LMGTLAPEAKHRCFSLVLLSSAPVHLCSAVRLRL
jgi:hypothetical protein